MAGAPPLPALTVTVADVAPATAAVGVGGVPGAASSAIVETRLVDSFATKSVPLALIAMLRGKIQLELNPEPKVLDTPPGVTFEIVLDP